MELDNLTLGEINRRANRYRHFKASRRLNPHDLEEIRQLDVRWIGKTCLSLGCGPQGYLDHYSRGIR